MRAKFEISSRRPYRKNLISTPRGIRSPKCYKHVVAVTFVVCWLCRSTIRLCTVHANSFVNSTLAVLLCVTYASSRTAGLIDLTDEEKLCVCVLCLCAMRLICMGAIKGWGDGFRCPLDCVGLT